MTPEQQLIAIAKACGWSDCKQGWYPWDTEGREGKGLFGHAPTSEVPTRIPDYLTNLNAMHEAEKTLTDEQFYLYGNLLDKITLPKTKMEMRYVHGPEAGMYRELVCATATQRAEAFLSIKTET